MSPDPIAANTQKSFELLLDLLGWEFVRSGDKAEEVSALGVVFNLSRTDEGIIAMANTEKRKADKANQIAEVLRMGRMSAATASSLKGRLGFAEGQFFAREKTHQRAGAPCLTPPYKGGTRGRHPACSGNVAERIVKPGPRRVEASTSDVVFLLTDASFDCETRSGGAIGEVEALAVLVAYRLWGLHIKSKHVVCFLDNEGSRFLILKGYSSNKVLDCIVHEIALCEEELSSLAWYARVPTGANIADHLSRLRQHAMLQAHAESKVEDLAGIPGRARNKIAMDVDWFAPPVIRARPAALPRERSARRKASGQTGNFIRGQLLARTSSVHSKVVQHAARLWPKNGTLVSSGRWAQDVPRGHVYVAMW
eukprot:s326_g10.t1